MENKTATLVQINAATTNHKAYEVLLVEMDQKIPEAIECNQATDTESFVYQAFNGDFRTQPEAVPFCVEALKEFSRDYGSMVFILEAQNYDVDSLVLERKLTQYTITDGVVTSEGVEELDEVESL